MHHAVGVDAEGSGVFEQEQVGLVAVGRGCIPLSLFSPKMNPGGVELYIINIVSYKIILEDGSK
jgi:hypothetical protein